MIHQSKEWFSEQYIKHKKSLGQIGLEFNISGKTLTKWIKRHGIEKRNDSEAMHAKTGRTININNNLNDVILGELLGDGCIVTSCELSGRYSHTSSKRGYLEWLRDVFLNDGMESGEIYSTMIDSFNTGNKRPSYSLISKTYAELIGYRKMFYPNGIKIVPDEIIISPTVLLHWYLGDGCLGFCYSGTRKCYYILLYTNGFTKTDVSALRDKLNQLGFEFTLSKRTRKGKLEPEWYLRNRVNNTQKFLNFIGPCPDPIKPIYGHKWG